ncbi:adenosylcobinamide amidohydrolase [Aestuariivita sp.]|jgi:adenosylcobinamide amidohydrolase|uniref:adenosylcobinamide amidohydrolase n=1 Tax=Aestuariivita sp. TaxID=1872407 RepID=UPI002170EEDA|nr:adenosylcobinamide amidohydrolase [Aestuariivita sp.]MCE8007856.1 adenosylcobinamide amidohydrolase [Aestuariivita sp.]
MRITLDHPWLTLDLGAPQRILSWSLNRPGFVDAQQILWREVRNADLPQDFDVAGWLCRELAARGASEAVTMLTSRDLDAYEVAQATLDGVTAHCVATVGLSNAERIGTRLDRSGHDWGTINIALCVDQPLADAARVELVSIAAQARTVAVAGIGHDLPTGRATGTGTDCIAIAAPAGALAFAGMHTPVGEAAGRAVHSAVQAGARIWMDRVRRKPGP